MLHTYSTLKEPNFSLARYSASNPWPERYVSDVFSPSHLTLPNCEVPVEIRSPFWLLPEFPVFICRHSFKNLVLTKT